jgi:hypothetical protein
MLQTLAIWLQIVGHYAHGIQNVYYVRMEFYGAKASELYGDE